MAVAWPQLPVIAAVGAGGWTAGTIGAILVTAVMALVLPAPVLVVAAILAMVTGLAYVLRSPFITTLGTTVLTIAAGALAGTSIPILNRMLSTLVGAAVGIVATLLIPVPRPQRRTDTTATV